MKRISQYLPVLLSLPLCGYSQGFDTIKINSHVPGLKIALLHRPVEATAQPVPVLFIHGSSFPSALAFGFRMNGISWMDHLAANQYDCYALDFLGYGNADRYPAMQQGAVNGKPPGRATDVYKDVDSAVNYILQRTGSRRLFLIGHSWGGSVAALYGSKFPEKIERLVLFAPLSAREEPGSPALIQHTYDTLTPDARVSAMRNLTPPGEDCQLEAEIFTRWKTAWLQSDPLAKSNGASVRFPSGPAQDIDDLTHQLPYYDPALIKVPVLLVRGEWDRYPSNEDAGLLLSRLTNAPFKKYVVIAKGTHVMHLEKNRFQLYQEVLHFLSDPIVMSDHQHSIAVIFEVLPAPGKKQEYLDIAASLKPELVKIDGFISIERFQSIYNPDKILSLSFWRDEAAIRQWRNLEMHREAQVKGRAGIFKDYHLRIAGVIRDYGMFDRDEAPADSRSYHQSGR